MEKPKRCEIPFDTTPKIAVYYIRKTFCESALCRGRITIPPFLVDFVTFFHAGKLPKKGGFSSVFGIIQQLLQSEAGFAEIYGRNPRENPCLIPKRKNRCFRIKSLLGAEKMPQGQWFCVAFCGFCRVSVAVRLDFNGWKL